MPQVPPPPSAPPPPSPQEPGYHIAVRSILWPYPDQFPAGSSSGRIGIGTQPRRSARQLLRSSLISEIKTTAPL